jgi:hypothetical protein
MQCFDASVFTLCMVSERTKLEYTSLPYTLMHQQVHNQSLSEIISFYTHSSSTEG